MTKKRKKRFMLAIVLAISSLSTATISASQRISVSHQACRYELQIPDGWDTIPQQVLKEKLKQYKVDWGIYPTSQEDFFSGRYALIGFLPAVNHLNRFTVKQIADDIAKLNKQSEITNDSLQIQYEEMKVDFQQNYRIFSYFAIRKNADFLKNCQIMHLSKFGYVSVFYYDKRQSSEKEEQDALANIIEIQPEYQYAEPSESGISLKYILISLFIGMLAYGFIVVSQKRKKQSA